MKAFILIPIMILLGFLITLLKTHIVLDVAQLFEVGFISAISFKTLFGFLLILSMIWSSFALNIAEKKSLEGSEAIKNGFVLYFALVIGLLISWGGAYIANWIFF